MSAVLLGPDTNIPNPPRPNRSRCVPSASAKPGVGAVQRVLDLRGGHDQHEMLGEHGQPAVFEPGEVEPDGGVLRHAERPREHRRVHAGQFVHVRRRVQPGGGLPHAGDQRDGLPRLPPNRRGPQALVRGGAVGDALGGPADAFENLLKVSERVVVAGPLLGGEVRPLDRFEQPPAECLEEGVAGRHGVGPAGGGWAAAQAASFTGPASGGATAFTSFSSAVTNGQASRSDRAR